MYDIDTMTKKIIPLAVVLKSTKKFATVASTLAKISRARKHEINTVNSRLDLIK